MLDDLDGVTVALMRMLRMLLSVFKPGIKNQTRCYYYKIYNFKTCHCLFPFYPGYMLLKVE
ncbi:MAG: hypothetical protein HBSIN01_14170 [Candidatus Brocadia sinica]|nr:MAG: hypothetical protein HBSIN01_14170 [Candidatus Brocadia sinica]